MEAPSIEEKPVDLKQLVKGYASVTAIPRKATDFNYRLAISRQLHRRRKNQSFMVSKLTRYDHTTERI